MCGGTTLYNGTIVAKVKQFDECKQFNYVKDLSPMAYTRRTSDAVFLKGQVFGGYDFNNIWIQTVNKYLPATKEWIKVAVTCDDRKNTVYALDDR